MDEQKPDEELQEEIAEIEHSDTTEEIVINTEKASVETPAVEVEEPVEEVVEEPETQELPQKLVEEPKRIGAPVPGKFERLKSFIAECKRVLRVTKKPDKQEFTTIVKISAIGIGIIGFIGFLVHFVKELLI